MTPEASIPQVATFMKVSHKQFAMDWLSVKQEEAMKAAETQYMREIYDSVKLPARATTGSAGYDFFLPHDIELAPGRATLVQTGIRVKIAPGWMLVLVPRSGLGFKYGLRLYNTVGIVDSDYFNAKNEGHIAAMLTTEAPLSLKAGDRFAQGILIPYGIASNDHILMKQRVSGFGSTGGI